MKVKAVDIVRSSSPFSQPLINMPAHLQSFDFDTFFFCSINNGSFESVIPNNEIIPDNDPVPTKRLKVSDINISRYQEEFVEMREIASGTFGTVKVARHRLDGMVYAIKVSDLHSAALQ